MWIGPGPANVRRTPLDWSLLLLTVMVLVSLWATFSIAFSLPKIAGLVFGLGLFYAVVARGRWAGMTAVFLALGAGVAGVGLLGTRWTTKIPLLSTITARLPADLIRLPGAENGLQPNEVAGVLVWVAPVAIGLAAGLWLHFEAWSRPGAACARWPRPCSPAWRRWAPAPYWCSPSRAARCWAWPWRCSTMLRAGRLAGAGALRPRWPSQGRRPAGTRIRFVIGRRSGGATGSASFDSHARCARAGSRCARVRPSPRLNPSAWRCTGRTRRHSVLAIWVEDFPLQLV